jgi:two-component sensor histidine kinase
MGIYFEAGVGKATAGSSLEMGRSAAMEAISQLEEFKPVLALVFVCSELDMSAVNQGVTQILGDCPIIGTSTAGEIANGLVMKGVVVSVIGSPHLKVRVGMGGGVSKDYRKAVNKALHEAGASDYFSSQHPLHQMLHISASGMPGVSPVLLMVFSPGATKTQPSLSHEIQTSLRKLSSNRIPIFGGSSGDYFNFESNYQIVNDNVSEDAIALAFVESEILFGLGMAHGFSPTTKQALVTKASGHIINELDGRPAAEVCAQLLEMPIGELGEGATWFSRFPFGATDQYGNSILQVPERILDDGSIQFGPLMKKDQVITLMRGSRLQIVRAGVLAYEKAIRQGGLNKPALILMFSCALRTRLMGDNGQKEIDLVYKQAGIPVCGYHTFGEKGISDDGLPVYANQSVSMLVFSDELNPVASLIHKGKSIYKEFASRLESKQSQIRSISRINQIIQDGTAVSRLLTALTRELSGLFPWADGAFYLPTDMSQTFTLASASDFERFPERIKTDEKRSGYMLIELDSHGKRFGLLVLRGKDGTSAPEEEDRVLAEIIAKLTASGLHRIELDGRLDVKLQQLEILNQIGTELSKAVSTSSQSQGIVRHMRRILKLSFASLWLVDRTNHVLVKETMDEDPRIEIGKVEKENDERLARWQIEHQQPFFFTKAKEDQWPINLVPPFHFSFVSLPVMSKGQMQGILNLYSNQQYRWSLQHERIFENMEFLQSISTQIAIFIENRSLHKHATFYREMHHRVKNNLQNIASLLRMQLRRLDRVSAEQALSDSIARIMSIALVHETLSQGEIGMVDLGRLVGSISKLPESDSLERPVITLDVSGPPVLVPSREATSLAMVINELLQNAVQHGFRERGKGKLSIKVERLDGKVSVIIQDDGPGLPKSLDPVRDGNLGLTIVRTLVKDELKGQFEIDSSEGTRATVTFPYPQGYCQIE